MKDKIPRPVCIDFETRGIEGRPNYPPKPVGISIKYPGKKAKYYAFGHPTNNNCIEAEAIAAAKVAWSWKDGILGQNMKFDLDVAETHWKIKPPAWNKVEDSMFLLFLDDPHQTELSLKPSATRLLGMPAEEQDAVADWLIKHQPVPGVKISRSKSSEHYFGRYICLAPGDLVGTYANGDVIRTEKLFELLYPKTIKRGMLGAYDRERQLMPILLEMERQGLPVDLRRLEVDVLGYQAWLNKYIEPWIIKTIKAPKDINLNSADQLIKAMITAGKADENLMPRTAGGKISTAKESLLLGVTDKQLLAVLKYRTQLSTCLNTFMMPWLETAKKSGGLIFTNWNQTKQPSGDANVGTRTGRLSSTPNFQNIPKAFSAIFHHDDPKLKLPKCPFKGLPPLPKVRSYVVPFNGEVFIDRDYSQQEPRILAHFDGGELLQKYLAEPWIDFHDYARAELAKMGKIYERKPVKNTNLGLIYGMGKGKLALKNDMSVEEAGELKNAILQLYPGLKQMYKDMKIRATQREPIRTWGGREYYCEEPAIVNGRLMMFDYKLVNVLIQGSAADCTKEAIIRYHAAKHKDAKLLLNVHDQLTASVPKKIMKAEMQVLRKTMESVEFDCPILSEGAVSSTNWDELKDYDKKGMVL